MKFKLRVLLYWLKLKLTRAFSSRQELEAFQQSMLDEFVSRLSESQFYRKLGIKSMADWNKIPVIDKETLMRHFGELNRPGISAIDAMEFAIYAERSREFNSRLKGITVGLSTGTSGKRGVFLVSEEERALWAATILSKVLQPRLFVQQKIAFFLRADSNLYSSVDSALFRFRYFDMFKPIDELAAGLNEYQPDVLAAQPSVLIELCRKQSSGAIAIYPKSIVSFAEVLHPRDKEVIERIFSVQIKEVYQCMEGFLGCTCTHGSMHLNEEAIFIEKEFIDGERFHPVITDFSRSTQFMVRYRLNDVLRLKKETCPCGSFSTAIEAIEGRDDDVLVFYDRAGREVRLFPDIISRKIAWLCDDFERYQLIQSEYRSISIGIECPTGRYDMVCGIFEAALKELLEEVNIEKNTVSLEFRQGVDWQQGSKYRKIQRRFQTAEQSL